MIKNIFIAALFFLVAVSVTAVYQSVISAPRRPIVVNSQPVIVSRPAQAAHPDAIKNNILLEFHSRPDEQHRPGHQKLSSAW